MKGILKGLAVLLFSVTTFSAPTATKTEGLPPAEQLASVEVFSIGFNGFVGHISEGERLMKILAMQTNARETFLNIAKNPDATVEAKLYAACALVAAGYKIPNTLFAPVYAMDVSVLRADILAKENFKEALLTLQKNGCYE